MSNDTKEQLPPFEEWWREYEELEIHKQSLDLLNRDAIAKRIARDAWNEAASRRAGEGEVAQRGLHWKFVYGATETACGRVAVGLRTSLLTDFVDCPDCQIAIAGYRHARTQIDAASAPVESERCAGCGHEAKYSDNGTRPCRKVLEYVPQAASDKTCNHRCDFSRPAPDIVEECPACGAEVVIGRNKTECAARCGWWIGRGWIERVAASRPASEAARRAAEKIAQWYQDATPPEDRTKIRESELKTIEMLIEAELTKD